MDILISDKVDFRRNIIYDIHKDKSQFNKKT